MGNNAGMPSNKRADAINISAADERDMVFGRAKPIDNMILPNASDIKTAESKKRQNNTKLKRRLQAYKANHIVYLGHGILLVR